MTGSLPLPEWVWVLIEKEGEQETLFALEEEGKGLKFIPAFDSQEDGQAARGGFPLKNGVIYEYQAMRLYEVAQAAQRNQMEIFILDREGKILDRLSPITDA